MEQTNLHSSRMYFIFGRMLNLMCRYVALSILLDPALFLRLPGPGAPYPVAEDFEPSRRPFFRRLLPGNAGGSDLKRAAVLRFHWFFTSSLLDCLMFTIGYDVLVILAVALRLDEPVQWKLEARAVRVSTLSALGWHVEILCDIDDSALSQSIFLHPVLLVIVFLGTLDKSGIQLTMTLSQLPS
ncbi:hypothetical protein Cob_v006859 [Colletotrichum orbiculare MAFF 240422]|uniref:Uncharacterized protein n=1 Tax=Colletotrichum orbiculare (strain 104-T / ATCC 96160 / CBS 514.97 / LARS 414 / MAFF 240422) TaxID=1213857 RepID=A0A484FQ67_COLOR|nr:hypothetical protein Cob_v006859 [Colletotrichum orbiculare MAFF 240422]